MKFNKTTIILDQDKDATDAEQFRNLSKEHIKTQLMNNIKFQNNYVKKSFFEKIFFQIKLLLWYYSYLF